MICRPTIRGLAVGLFCSHALVGGGLESATKHLTPRETIELIREYPNNNQEYERFWLANPDVKPALYDCLIGAAKVDEQDAAAMLVGVTGDEMDVPRLVRLLQRQESKNQAQVRRPILRAVRMLGDRGAAAGYAALERLCNPAAWPQTHGTEIDAALWDLVIALRESNHPEFPRLLKSLRQAQAGQELQGKIETEAAELQRYQREKGDGLRTFRPGKVDREGAAREVAQLAAGLAAGGRQAESAAYSLELCGVAAAAALPAIEPHLTSTTDPFMLVQLLITLGEIGPPAKTLAAKVRPLLGHPEDRVRAFAAMALARMGDAVPETKQCLARALGDRSSLVRLHVLTAFGVLGAEIEPPVAATLTEIMQNDRQGHLDPGYLGKGRNADQPFPTSLPDVIRFAEENKTPLRCAAAFALGRTHAKVPSPALIEALGGSRDLTLYVLEMADATWAGRTELLAPVLRLLGRARDDETLAVLAVDALVAIGAPPPEVIAALVAQCAAGGAWPRVHALRALGQLGDRDTPALIRPLLDNDNEFVKDAAAQALKALDARSR